MADTTYAALAALEAKAWKSLKGLEQIVRRAERGVLTGRNSAATHACALGHFEDAFRVSLEIQDTFNVDAAADVADSLMRWRQRGVFAGVFSAQDIRDIERSVIG